jgi:hypothetical protein
MANWESGGEEISSRLASKRGCGRMEKVPDMHFDFRKMGVSRSNS